jgi:hypothetical protein
LLLVNLLVQL